ncbi:hypothetical protein HN512_05405 [Candidatus Peregrinibacteria bacterium]|jgi:hypothetical protein|nr:hypothetical protein [Candidatus Peregrinibacteria bacterium]MBT3599241.1 hypothetical protein [Candidatus Peregrinibacteria bacterium]MBT4586048.1 hypothetical protein [Candidatus Peregrinibacteria bacterium]MBT6731137.1 hypothetical protein [Candidatus Peregrinibacteria bacterium]MBT7009000.1 hypothetical protein [Candidatus Peregrinibacteria bacterium]
MSGKVTIGGTDYPLPEELSGVGNFETCVKRDGETMTLKVMNGPTFGCSVILGRLSDCLNCERTSDLSIEEVINNVIADIQRTLESGVELWEG